MPANISSDNRIIVSYTYNASGEKLLAHYNYGSAGAGYVYCGNFKYVNNTLKEIRTDGGYITFSGSTPVYHYYLKDHLGSNRVVCSASGSVEQVNHYYPFGGLFGESTGGDTQRYKYNDKVFDQTRGIKWYDYGARYMSPDVGRFTTMDQMAEKYYSVSPYAYCGNNPINAIDPNGMDWYKDKDGTYQFRPEVHSQQDLDKGQTYLWKSNNMSSKGINYRSDGSILYNNETVAYNRMWNQADRHYRTKDEPRGREIGAFIISNGQILVLPDYANDLNSSNISDYGYRVNSEGILKHGNEFFNIIAQIHTHQKGAGNPFPSFYDVSGTYDGKLSEIMGARPVLVMGHDKKLHGIIQNNKNQGIMEFPYPLNSLDYILKGGKYSLYKYLYNNRNKWPIKF